ncbi:hypothetical protein HID58_092738 [Brassica napus]|uniref:Uncharacterized protein n=1 Tax=Brassica napus TaxID=3708 RepID=A0ABQ7XG48_BRANA|nr:hypothetical protein HID58_092738 [Brassica napus]
MANGFKGVGEEPVSLTKRRFRSKNIEPIPFWKMQVVPFNGKLVKAKKRCHWCGTRGCEDLVSCLSCGREFFCVDCIDKGILSYYVCSRTYLVYREHWSFSLEFRIII